MDTTNDITPELNEETAQATETKAPQASAKDKTAGKSALSLPRP